MWYNRSNRIFDGITLGRGGLVPPLPTLTRKDKVFEIYKIENLVNGKIYIGLTSFGHRKRWSCHKSYAKRGSRSLLHCAIRKHGAENFVISVIDTTETRDLAKERERHWIAELKSDDRKIGYNVKEGGELYTLSEETKQKISEAHLRLYENPEYLEVHKALRPKGEWKPPQEWTDKMKASHQKRKEQGLKPKRVYTPLSEEQKQKVRDGVRRYYEEHPEAKKNNSEKTKKFFEEHPEQKEVLSRLAAKQNESRERDQDGKFLKQAA